MKKILQLNGNYGFPFVSLFFLVASFFFMQDCNAQGAPPFVNYQAVARDVSGSMLVSQNISVRFTFHAGSAGGAIEYQETHAKTTNAFGLFTAAIGSGNVTSGSWAGIDFNGADQYLQVEMDPAGGTAWTDMGTSQLLSVPYAMNSLTTGAISGSPNYVSKFNTANTLNSSALYDAGGTFGIGTIAPNAHLHIMDNGSAFYSLYVFKNGTNENAIFIKDNPTSYTANVSMSYNNVNGMPTLQSVTTGNGPAGSFDGGATGSAIYASCNGATTALAVSQGGTGTAGYFYAPNGFGLVVAGGKVGIGTSVPVYLLDVMDPGSGTTVNINNSGGGNAMNVNTDNGSFGIVASCGATQGTGIKGSCDTGANAWGIAGFSNEGIGGEFSTVSGVAGYFNGNIAGTGTFTYTSDAKLKKNIQPLSGTLEKIMLLKPSTYQYRVGEFGTMTLSGGNHFGVIAQDLQKVFPELVKQENYSGVKDPNTGKLSGGVDYLSVNYNELIPILIKGMQEQQALIGELKTELQALKNNSNK